jgi:Kef-type K+ transport system membrane component KefB
MRSGQYRLIALLIVLCVGLQVYRQNLSISYAGSLAALPPENSTLRGGETPVRLGVRFGQPVGTSPDTSFKGGILSFSSNVAPQSRIENFAEKALTTASDSSAEGSGPALSSAAKHSQTVALVLISLVIILLSAKLGGELFERLRQPAVLGELVFGVVVGNLALLGYHGLDYLKNNEVIRVLAEIGVIFLLFEVGLQSNIKEMLEVGASSFMVALFGVIAPMILGWGVGAVFLPQAGTLVHVFIGATLSATSVGITARVLKDLGKSSEKEARIILGAAVIDDVMGLVVLAAVSGIITAADKGDAGVSALSIGIIIFKAIAFLVGAIWIGSRLSRAMFGLASKLKVHGMLLATSIAFCFFLAFLASQIELAPIVGAFAAGLILDPVHYRDFSDRGEHSIEESISPITSFLVPIFFVLMGLRVDLRTFMRVDIVGFALALTAVAILGKQACALGVMEKGLDRISVGVGMIPRGEVGLIFASIGASMTLGGVPVVSAATYSAVVIMVIATTLITPIILKMTLERGERRKKMRHSDPITTRAS